MPTSIPSDRWCVTCSRVLQGTMEDAEMDARCVRLHDVMDVPQIYGLSLWEPWLWAITEIPEPRAKRVENRPWPPYPWVRCQRWIALHATPTYDLEAQIRVGQRGGRLPPGKLTAEMLGRRGHVIAMARIDGALAPGEPMPPFHSNAAAWWFPEQYGWQIGALWKLPQAVKVKGGQKLFRIPVPAAVELARQIPDVVRGALAHPRLIAA